MLHFHERVDFPLEMKRVMTPVRHQGNSEVCWAATLVDMMSALNKNSAGCVIALSMQDCVEKFRHYLKLKENQLDERGGFGWNIAAALFRVEEIGGICSEYLHPWVGFVFPEPEPSANVLITRPGVVPYGIMEVNDVEECLRQLKPFAATIIIIGDDLYIHDPLVGNGIFCRPLTDSSLLDKFLIEQNDNLRPHLYSSHCVLVVGAGIEDGVEFFWIKNSWGKDWGLGGYCKIMKDLLFNFIGIEGVKKMEPGASTSRG